MFKKAFQFFLFAVIFEFTSFLLKISFNIEIKLIEKGMHCVPNRRINVS